MAVGEDGTQMDTVREGRDTYGKKIGRQCDKKRRIKSKWERKDRRGGRGGPRAHLCILKAYAGLNIGQLQR